MKDFKSILKEIAPKSKILSRLLSRKKKIGFKLFEIEEITPMERCRTCFTPWLVHPNKHEFIGPSGNRTRG